MLFVASIVSGQISATNVYISNGINISQTPIASAWTFDAETQTITAYDGSLGADVTVPETISGLQVLHIGDSAFYASNITQIVIPSSCMSVGNGAFMTQAGINKITINAGVSIADISSFNDTSQTQASFKAFYEAGGSLNGTYEYSGGAWSKTY
mgnify:CR=1 FL=1